MLATGNVARFYSGHRIFQDQNPLSIARGSPPAMAPKPRHYGARAHSHPAIVAALWQQPPAPHGASAGALP